MKNYMDGFVFPIPRMHLTEYKNVAEKVTEIWKEYGDLAYYEYVGEDLKAEGMRSFLEFVELKGEEVIVFVDGFFPFKGDS